MCGIVGLFLKNKTLEPKLGEMLSAMLQTMTDRGPDSAGFAIYRSEGGDMVKLTVRADYALGAAALQAANDSVGGNLKITPRDTHTVIHVPAKDESKVRDALRKAAPDARIVSVGNRMEIYKEVGLPADVAQRFALESMAGTHGIGHTRMATESAVTTQGAHPFTTGMDQCLVHNGSLSNHASLRRELQRDGIQFATDNDSEVAAGYITSRLKSGDTLKEALEHALEDLDGFYTFVVGTERGFGVLRDPIACKPAVMAETEDYVAFGSEYRVLAGLPGIESARVWEPEPATVYFWERAA